METFSALLAFVHGITRSPVNTPHKSQWRGALMFSLICAWINAWVNNREAGDLRRHRAHYDVIVIEAKTFQTLWTLFHKRFSWWYVHGHKIALSPNIDSIYYWSYKDFNEESYVKDLHSVAFMVCDIFDDADDNAWCFKKVLTDGMEKNTPLSQKSSRSLKYPTWILNSVRLEGICFEMNMKRSGMYTGWNGISRHYS